MSSEFKSNNKDYEFINEINSHKDMTWVDKMIKIIDYVKTNKRDNLDILEEVAFDFCTLIEKAHKPDPMLKHLVFSPCSCQALY